MIHAVGRMKAGPEQMLVERYTGRLSKAGPAVGIDWARTSEIGESRAQTAPLRKREEAEKLHALIDKGAVLILFDERGKALGSQDFAALICRLRDDGTQTLVAAIGGPDGHDESLRPRATHVLSFGAMTWPHQIARILLAEQFYRAVMILAGHPYHRD